MSYSRVQVSVYQISQQVQNENEHRVYDHNAHDDRVVSIKRAVDERPPDTWQTKDRLDNHGPGHDRRDCRTQVTHDRYKHRSEDMTDNDFSFPQSLGTRGPNVVGGQGLEHRASRDARKGSDFGQRQSENGQNKVPKITTIPSRDRQPSQVNAKNHDENG
ncbi:uncharacterized protein METZ01_LOCUS139586, partial [marine metagenome]